MRFFMAPEAAMARLPESPEPTPYGAQAAQITGRRARADSGRFSQLEFSSLIDRQRQPVSDP